MKKEHVANLFRQMSFFRPKLVEGEFHQEFLVNQIAVDKYKGQQAAIGKPVLIKCPPDRDTLLDLIGKAGLEMKLFMKEMDDSQQAHQAIISDMMLISSRLGAALGEKPDDTDPMLLLEKLMGRYEQMAAWVSDIACSDDDGIPTKIYKAACFLNSKVNKPLVNQNNGKEETAGGSVQLSDTKVFTEGEEVGEATHLQILPEPSQTETGTDGMGVPQDQAEDSGGVAPSPPDQH